ncbi:hypothetical protein BGZ70_003157, partial [Mortierella alpina]
MAKGDIATPPGTGLVGKLTPEQKELLKQMWAEIFQIADSGVLDVPNDLLPASVETASIKSKTSAAKKGWFGSTKSAPAATAEVPTTRVNLADIGLSVDQLRPALWNNILGDHP